MKKYFPLLLTKSGELTALSKLNPRVKDEISPILQVLDDSYDKVKSFALNNWAFNGSQIFLDFSLSSFNDIRINNLIETLSILEIDVVPVFSPNSIRQYTTLLTSLLNTQIITGICIRFSNVGGNFTNVNSELIKVAQNIGVAPGEISILLDAGFVDNHNYTSMITSITDTIRGIIQSSNYANIIIASSSFPKDLSHLIPAGRLHRLRRYEWEIWLALSLQSDISKIIKYGDYGAKYPYYIEANFQGTCSIKYTSPNEFIIYRGELSGNHPDGNGQYITFSQELFNSQFYSGSTFSWGDERIGFYASQQLTDPKRKKGNSKNWVEISQNHHLTLLHSIL